MLTLFRCPEKTQISSRCGSQVLRNTNIFGPTPSCNGPPNPQHMSFGTIRRPPFTTFGEAALAATLNGRLKIRFIGEAALADNLRRQQSQTRSQSADRAIDRSPDRSPDLFPIAVPIAAFGRTVHATLPTRSQFPDRTNRTDRNPIARLLSRLQPSNSRSRPIAPEQDV